MLVGISCYNAKFQVGVSSAHEISSLSHCYQDIAIAEGADHILLPADKSTGHCAKLADLLDGLILSSGPDVHPHSYGEDLRVDYADGVQLGRAYLRSARMRALPARDQFELELIREFLKRKKPILGVCRGMQLINVAFGGTLYQELPEASADDHFIESDGWVRHHPMAVARDSFLYELLGRDDAYFPSIHHQGVKLLGATLRAGAVAEDGLVEALETVDGGFCMGVQAHIERAYFYNESAKCIWRAFFAAAGAKR
jgi:putative glutamine amidotransferase